MTHLHAKIPKALPLGILGGVGWGGWLSCSQSDCCEPDIFVLLAEIRLLLQCRFLNTKPALKKKRHYSLKQKRNVLLVIFKNTFSAVAKLIAI